MGEPLCECLKAAPVLPARGKVETLWREELIERLFDAEAGERLVARGRVVKAGRTLTLAMAEVFAVSDGVEKLCAMLTATCMTIAGRDGVAD